MPRTGGTYAVPSGTKGVTLETIQSGKYNAFLDDLTFDLNAARPVTAGGTGATTEDGAAEALGLVSAKDLAGVNTVGGTANAITIVTARDYDAYANTLYLSFKAASNIAAGGTTIDLDGNGAKSVYKVVAAGLVDINVGDIIAGGRYTIGFDTAADAGDGAFILLNPGNASSSFQVGDFLSTARTLSADWLRRDGALYDSDDYPELAAILPALADGVKWKTYNSDTTYLQTDVTKHDDVYILAGGSGGETNFSTSTDAKNWLVTTVLASFLITGLAHGLGISVAVDTAGKYSVSTDGMVWAAPVSAGGSSFNGLAFNASVFVGVGDGGVIKTFDGSSWTTRTSGTSSALTWVSAANGIFLAGGNSGLLLTSPDGITWTTRTSGVSATLAAATYFNGLYIVVGSGGTIITSPTLATWTTRTSGTSVALGGVAASSTICVAAGANGVALTTENGTSYTASITGTTAFIRNLMVDPDNNTLFIGPSGPSVAVIGTKTSPTQFQVPDDDPEFGWIKAVS